MSNESIIAVPSNVEEPGQARLFLNKLVEQLDVSLGFRFDAASGPSTNFQKKLTEARTPTGTLSEQIQDAVNRIAVLEEDLAILEGLVEDIQQGTAVTDLSYTAFTAAGTYDQSQVQDLTDNLKTTSDKVNEALTVLRAAGIMT